MRRLIAAAAMVAGLAFAAPAHAAGVLTGEELNRTCASRDDHGFVGFCLGFVSAAVEMWTYVQLDKAKCLFTLPDRVTPDQEIAVVTKYLRDHPEKWSDPAFVSILAAFKEAWPCEPG